MKIGLISSVVPFTLGGYRFIVEWAHVKLAERGHQVETLYLPSSDDPATLLRQMSAFQSIRVDRYYDRVITFRPPAHMISHPNKIVWFIHHFRLLYDLWQHDLCPIPDTASGRALRDQVRANDTVALRGATRVFANSQVVADRLQLFNNITAEVLYPPVLHPERFTSGRYGDAIVCICRIEPHKRQDLLIEALAACQTPVRLQLCGPSSSIEYARQLDLLARRLGVADRVNIRNEWISEAEKEKLLEGALAAAYVPFDEDSYGYPVIEAAHAHRCIVSVSDAGGVGEFVVDGLNGFLVEPRADALARAFDRLYLDRNLARRLGDEASSRLQVLKIDWEHVVDRLLA